MASMEELSKKGRPSTYATERRQIKELDLLDQKKRAVAKSKGSAGDGLRADPEGPSKAQRVLDRAREAARKAKQ